MGSLAQAILLLPAPGPVVFGCVPGTVYKDLRRRGGVWVGPMGGRLFKCDYSTVKICVKICFGWPFGGPRPPPPPLL